MAQETEMKSPRRLIRRNQLDPVYGIDWGDAQLSELVKAGLFPAPIRHEDGVRALGWMSDEIDAWFEARAKERDERLAAEKAEDAPPQKVESPLRSYWAKRREASAIEA